MAASKLLLFSLFLTLIFARSTADAGTDNVDGFKPELSDSSLKIELDQLNSKVSLLESSIDDKIHELKRKDKSIKQMGNIIQEKSATIASLQSEIQALQGSLDAKEQVGRAHARVGELENQVEKLRKEIETQNKKRDALETQVKVSEQKVLELNSKLESLHRINDEQKSRIRKTERALQVAEEEMMKAKLEANTVSKELIEVREAWIPHWLATHLLHCQSFIVTHWREHGSPAFDATFQKALQKKAEVEKWAEPHIETVKTIWIPIMKDQWLRFATQFGLHVKSLTAKTIEVYHASKNSIVPHVAKVQEMVDPHFQEVKKFTKPYIDQVTTMTKPHVDKAHLLMKPYTKKVIRTYRKCIRAATKYHRQVQATIHEKLKSHDLTKPLATDELVSLMAFALMAAPLIFLFNVASSIFCKKPKKRTRNSHTSHTRRRAKRVHPEK
ncbi:hypothetical protein CsSME_00008727 [Camellia sinensis var. sinensis]|uniref:uncharacterized protein LOC114281495 isoform X1 n=2 Tax=Camellia sinensis TaxID=4442 RepID=UPI0010364F56|nr:uncharacterized protein LOC114281495 isoform X1 [Camellia sinensis]XP_028079767.1 uncharacterized protein LOC114281495 isoform X1 [Camellia sinensis]